MDWEAVGTAATFLTGLGVIGSFVIAIRSLRQDRQRYEATARRAERAAEISDTNANRVIDALWTIAEAGSVPGGAAPRQPQAQWSMEHFDGDRYSLTNVGRATATDVELSADDTLIGPSEYEGTPVNRMNPNDSFTFTAVRTPGTRDSTITVSWITDGESERRAWCYPLPAHPPLP